MKQCLVSYVACWSEEKPLVLFPSEARAEHTEETTEALASHVLVSSRIKLLIPTILTYVILIIYSVIKIFVALSHYSQAFVAIMMLGLRKLLFLSLNFVIDACTRNWDFICWDRWKNSVPINCIISSENSKIFLVSSWLQCLFFLYLISERL